MKKNISGLRSMLEKTQTAHRMQGINEISSEKSDNKRMPRELVSQPEVILYQNCFNGLSLVVVLIGVAFFGSSSKLFCQLKSYCKVD